MRSASSTDYEQLQMKRSPNSLRTRRSFGYFVDSNRLRMPQRFVVTVTMSVNGETLVAETALTR